jgi:uncharacterized membrane protein YhaH (DUF805 family)
LRPGRKFTIDRKGYWIATAVLLALQWFGPKITGVVLLAPWIMLYLARLRDAGRSALHLLHLAAVMVLIFIPAFIAPDAFGAYLSDVPSEQAPSTVDTIVFLVCVVGCLVYYIAFSIWLGCIKTKARANPAALADAFS